MGSELKHRETALPVSEWSQSALVEQARNRQEFAIRELVRRLNVRLFRVARGIVNTDADAEEVVQETYLTAFTRLDEFRGDARFSTWITRIAVNTARMRLRGAGSRTQPFDTVQEPPPMKERVVNFPGVDDQESPYDRAGREQFRQMLESAVTNLPPELRIVFLLREGEGQSILGIARDLSLNPVTVKTRLFRARRRLRKQLEDRLQGGFDMIFPFAGRRCARMADRVVQRLPWW